MEKRFLNFFEIYDELTNKSLFIEAFNFEQAEKIASEIEFNNFNDGEEIEFINH
jgi:hypothetical protein